MRFEKTGVIRWISHLDTIGTIEKALRRAILPVALTQGFNPRPKMSIASPLAVGITSEGEYLDIIFQRELDLEQAQQQLNHELPLGLQITSCQELSARAPSLMAIVQLSRYRLLLPQWDLSTWQDHVEYIMSLSSVVVPRERKKSVSPSSEDIRPGLVSMIISEAEEGVLLDATVETSSKLFVRLPDITRILHREKGNWSLSDSNPHRLDIGVREANSFCSLEDYFRLASRRYIV